MNDALTAAATETIAQCLSVSYREFRGDDGEWEIEASVGGKQLALTIHRSRERALAEAKAEVASLLEQLAFSLRAEVGQTPSNA